MDKIKNILERCQCGVSITVNNHRDYYQSVKEYVEELASIDNALMDEIGLDVYKQMKKSNTIVEIQAYPDTPLGFYRVLHYDIEKALNKMLDCLNSD